MNILKKNSMFLYSFASYALKLLECPKSDMMQLTLLFLKKSSKDIGSAFGLLIDRWNSMFMVMETSRHENEQPLPLLFNFVKLNTWYKNYSRQRKTSENEDEDSFDPEEMLSGVHNFSNESSGK
jgi:hypothetical protein